jgi:hypothetical protein
MSATVPHAALLEARAAEESQCRALLNQINVQKSLHTTEITFAPCLFAVYEGAHHHHRSRQ